jgi:putative Mg2+ transporter-C (MgtC) family protein
MIWQDTLGRLALALLLGGIIGFERQWRQHTAGLRTNALVAIGSASFVLFGTTFPNPDSMARVACQIIPGIGFLGAGVIMREGVNIKGLNTAATLWCSAAVGMFAGLGYGVSAAICAGFIVITNLFLRPLVNLINRRPASFTMETELIYTLSIACHSTDEARIRESLLQRIAARSLSLRKLESADIKGSELVVIRAALVATGSKDASIEYSIGLEHIIGKMSLEAGVTSAEWHTEAHKESARLANFLQA